MQSCGLLPGHRADSGSRVPAPPSHAATPLSLRRETRRRYTKRSASMSDCWGSLWTSPSASRRRMLGKGRHDNFAWPHVEVLVVQASRQECTLHTDLPPDTDFEPVIRDVVGFPCEIEIRHVVPWCHHLLVAEYYRDRRVFLAGDAVHLVTPNGGLGMNTGVGDAFDLSWKLGGVIKG
jgi:hypothetical protein